MTPKLKTVMIFVMAFAIIYLCIVGKECRADEYLTVAVVDSNPYYGLNHEYIEQCNGSICKEIPGPPLYYLTTFTNGRVQFTIQTRMKLQFDSIYLIIRNCQGEVCEYKSATPAGMLHSPNLPIKRG